MYKPKVYTASKIHHRPMWENLREIWSPQIDFTARWLDMEGPDHDTTFWNDAQKRLHWIQDIQDVRRSDWLLAYNDEGTDKLSGSLIETGGAIMLGMPVIAIGFPRRHSWTALPWVFSLPSCHDAFMLITGKV